MAKLNILTLNAWSIRVQLALLFRGVVEIKISETNPKSKKFLTLKDQPRKNLN
jgi:hypothetical protein